MDKNTKLGAFGETFGCLNGSPATTGYQNVRVQPSTTSGCFTIILKLIFQDFSIAALENAPHALSYPENA